MQCDMKRVHRRSQLKKRYNPMSKARRIQARHRATDCTSQAPPEIHESGNQKRQIWKVKSGCQKKEQQNASSSSGRKGSQKPNAQASGDRLQSQLKEDEEVINLLSLGAKLTPNLVTWVGANLKRTLGTLDFDIFPSAHCNVVQFPTRLLVRTIPNEQIRRDVHQKVEHPGWKTS